MNPSQCLSDRRSFLKGVSLGTGGLLLAPLLQKIAAAADGNVTPPAGKAPAGLRLAWDRSSWNVERSEPLCKAAGIEGHRYLSPLASTVEKITPIMETGQADAYLLCTHNDLGAYLDDGRIQKFIELGLKHNPNFRGAFLQLGWLVHDGGQETGTGEIKTGDDYEKSDLARVQAKLDRERKVIEAKVDAINRKLGRQMIFLVPVGDAIMELRRMITAGRFPGVTKQSAVFSGDSMPHPGTLSFELGRYCHFAVMYRMNPMDLDVVGETKSAEQSAILKKLAWDIVSKYPHAGIAKYDVSARSDVAGNAAPAAGVVAPAKAEALKGWNATQDLPDDTVVTDYNDYIERLPKAERPGVSDVKYYVDGTGRNAVAVLVNAGGAQWTHLLVYDKQNKRTGVTRFVAGK